MPTRQYVGARYVPKFASPSEWNSKIPYEALTIVLYLNNSYTSKKPVPPGIEPTNTAYWALTGNYNAQVEQYRQEVEGVRDDFTALEASVEADVQQMQNLVNDTVTAINNDLQDTIEQVNQTVQDALAEVDETISTISEVIPLELTGDNHADYQATVMNACASWLAHNIGSAGSINGTSNATNKAVYKYDANKTWLFADQANQESSFLSGFVTTDTETIGGTSYPVAYLTCSTWLAMITKGRDYLNSPYYYAFTTSSPTWANILTRCQEMGGDYGTDYPFTFDWCNSITTYRMANMMDRIGVSGKLVYSANGAQDAVFTDYYNELETGDILFYADDRYPNQYKHIHHCAMYIKDLADLNKYATQYGCTFRARVSTPDNPQYGYMIDFAESQDGSETGYQDCLKITTLWRYANYFSTDQTGRKCYGYKVGTSALLSSRTINCLTGILPQNRSALMTTKIGTGVLNGFDTRTGGFVSESFAVGGIEITSNTFDCNSSRTGVFRLRNQSGYVENILNGPENRTTPKWTRPYFIQMGIGTNYKMQLWFDLDKAWFRLNRTSQWGDWVQIGGATA